MSPTHTIMHDIVLTWKHQYLYFEEIGTATLVKRVGNFLIVSAGYSMREALSIAEKSGADPKPVVDMLAGTVFSTPMYQSYGKRIAESNAPFTRASLNSDKRNRVTGILRFVGVSIPHSRVEANSYVE